jgi:hypothetical protein
MSLVSPSIESNAPVPDQAAAELLLPTAEALAEECFADVRRKRVTWEADAETGERWLELRLTVGGDGHDVAAAYDRYVARWVSAVPWPQHHWVRLSYELV